MPAHSTIRRRDVPLRAQCQMVSRSCDGRSHQWSSHFHCRAKRFCRQLGHGCRTDEHKDWLSGILGLRRFCRGPRAEERQFGIRRGEAGPRGRSPGCGPMDSPPRCKQPAHTLPPPNAHSCPGRGGAEQAEGIVRQPRCSTHLLSQWHGERSVPPLPDGCCRPTRKGRGIGPRRRTRHSCARSEPPDSICRFLPRPRASPAVAREGLRRSQRSDHLDQPVPKPQRGDPDLIWQVSEWRRECAPVSPGASPARLSAEEFLPRAQSAPQTARSQPRRRGSPARAGRLAAPRLGGQSDTAPPSAGPRIAPGVDIRIPLPRSTRRRSHSRPWPAEHRAMLRSRPSADFPAERFPVSPTPTQQRRRAPDRARAPRRPAGLPQLDANLLGATLRVRRTLPAQTHTRPAHPPPRPPNSHHQD